MRSEIFISINPLGSTPRKSIIDPIFCIRSIVNKYKKKNNKLCMAIIELEKSSHILLPREMVIVLSEY